MIGDLCVFSAVVHPPGPDLRNFASKCRKSRTPTNRVQERFEAMTDAPLSLSTGPFNSALETGVRALWVLSEPHPQAFDLQRLVYFDYLVVHSADAGGPTSLHPRTPLRNGELLVRRGLIERGLLLMISRGLAERRIETRGLGFAATGQRDV